MSTREPSTCTSTLMLSGKVLSPVNGGETIIIPDWYFNPGLTDDGVELVMEIMKKYDKFNVPLINPEGGNYPMD